VLTCLPEPSEEDRYGQEYWYNADDQVEADHDCDVDSDQSAGLSSLPSPSDQPARRRAPWLF
jgi:hypothetical protein